MLVEVLFSIFGINSLPLVCVLKLDDKNADTSCCNDVSYGCLLGLLFYSVAYTKDNPVNRRNHGLNNNQNVLEVLTNKSTLTA